MTYMHFLVIASVKGGVGKSTVAFALGLAAMLRELRVVVVDLDPSRWVSAAFGVAKAEASVTDVLTDRVPLARAVVASHLGVAVLPGSRDLYRIALSHEAMTKLRAELGAFADVVILDTHPGENLLPAALRSSDRIVVPTTLDRASVVVATDTVRLAASLNVLDRVGGILSANIKLRRREPEDIEGREIYSHMRLLGVGYENIMASTKLWSRATSASEVPPPALLDFASLLLEEVLARRCDPMRLRIWMEEYDRNALPERAAEAG